jgi:transaldolase
LKRPAGWRWRWPALYRSGSLGFHWNKDPTYSNVLCVKTLIGPDTLNTMPPKTVDAFRDHGRVALTLMPDPTGPHAILREIHALGLELDGVTDDLIRDGVGP